MLAPQVARNRRVVATFETGSMPGHDLDIDPRRGRFVTKTEEAIGREEELGDRAVCARVHLPLQILEIERAGRQSPDASLDKPATEISNGATFFKPSTSSAASR